MGDTSSGTLCMSSHVTSTTCSVTLHLRQYSTITLIVGQLPGVSCSEIGAGSAAVDLERTAAALFSVVLYQCHNSAGSTGTGLKGNVLVLCRVVLHCPCGGVSEYLASH